MMYFIAGFMSAALVLAIIFKPPGPTAGAVQTSSFEPVSVL